MKRLLVPALAAAIAATAGAVLAEQDSTATTQNGEALATFAGGCFWCMEPP